MEQDAAIHHAVIILKVVVLIYILASPVILHDSASVFNNDMFHLASVVVSAGLLLVDRTLGVLMLIASAIMIGSFNYHAEKQAKKSSSEKSEIPKPLAPIDSVMLDTATVPVPAIVPVVEVHKPQDVPIGPVRPVVENVVETMEIPSEIKGGVKGSEKEKGMYALGAKEIHAPLDFLTSPGLNPNGFVTAESLAKIQTNTVYDGSLDNVYSPLGAGVYTAQGVLPGVDISAP